MTTTTLLPPVAHDLWIAVECCGIDRDGYTDRDPRTTSMCDVQLMGAALEHDDDDDDDASRVVGACRFVLAARSVVFHRMLYGNYRESAPTARVCLWRYPIMVLQTIVYYCSYATLNPRFPMSVSELKLQWLLLEAADYLQLGDLCDLVTRHILLPHLRRFPERTTCRIYELGIVPSLHLDFTNDGATVKVESTSGTAPSTLSPMEHLFTIVQQMIETRPYITLDPNNTYCYCIHSNKTNSIFDSGSDHDNLMNTNEHDETDRNNKNMNNTTDRYSTDDLAGGGGGITQLSLDKVQHLFASKQNICASELFLLHQLLRWYQHHMYRLHWILQHQKKEKEVDPSRPNAPNDDDNCESRPPVATGRTTDMEQEIEILTSTAKRIFDTSIELSHIEPVHLLQFISPSSSSHTNEWIRHIVTPERIYQAISQQALRASQCKSWSLPHLNGIRNTVIQSPSPQKQHESSDATRTPSSTVMTVTIPERVLIEGSGHHDVDGMYYRINTNNSNSGSGQSIRSGSSTSRGGRSSYNNNSSFHKNGSLVKNVLYTKREIMVGQQNVYTLSRCLRNRRKLAPPFRPQYSQTNKTSGGGTDCVDLQEHLSEDIRVKCLIGSPGVDADGRSIDNGNGGDGVDEEHDEEEEEAYYECRLFSSPFLTFRAVRQLQLMQIMSTIVPCYQPVMQLLDWSPPANSQHGGGSSSPPMVSNNMNTSTAFVLPTNMDQPSRQGPFSNNDTHSSISGTNLVIPTPIRKYYRIRLSDGEYHIPGTIAPELNGLIERKELDVNRVIQIQEFGVYTMYGCTSIHVLKAVVVTGNNATPIHIFGNPVPLEDAEPMDISNIPDDIQINSKSVGTSGGRLQNLYRAEVVVSHEVDDPQHGHTDTSSISLVASSSFYASGCIPKTGWIVDDHGIEPAPECTWIPPSTTTTFIKSTTL